ncbi:GIY-YIG nuclease family protein [Streptomyces olivaceus]
MGLESELISQLDLPLNLDQNHHNAFHDRLKKLRAQARQQARALPTDA